MFFDVQSTEKELVAHHVRLLGATADVSKDTAAGAGGYGITPSRTAVGSYKLAWDENPGTFVGWHADLGAATPANLAGHTLVRDTYDATNFELEFAMYDSLFAAHDLAAAEYIDIVVYFQG